MYHHETGLLMLTSSWLLAGVARAQEFKDISIYSTPGCGDDPNDFETQSSILIFSPKPKRDPKAAWTDCMKSTTHLSEWPKVDQARTRSTSTRRPSTPTAT
ncbi:hypothetical protein PG994_014502 [Apiospora phragmitis]|uniref:Uncharacterized protein n=1 Tax=Apiospora phragmitis TaxID=2905665 RepID=A0ABR1T699_9PEZI